MKAYTYTEEGLEKFRTKLEKQLEESNPRTSSLKIAKIKEDLAFIDEELKRKGLN